MRRSLLLLLLVLGCRKATVEVRPDDKQSGPPRVTCKLVEPIATATVPARCDLAIDKVVQVHAGESLEIGAGAKLTFAKGAGLVLDGGALKAKGTAEEPIVFTSATRVAGDWTGIVFRHRPYDKSPKLVKPDSGVDAASLPPNGESSLEHVVVEFGGARAEEIPTYIKETAGVFVMPFVGDTVALSHVKLRNNAGHALWIDADSAVTGLEAIDFDTGSVRVPFGLAEAVSATPAGSVTLFGALTKSLVLPRRTYVLARYNAVRATAAPVTLEIAKGSTIKLEKGGSLSFQGSSKLAKLVANGVTFTSNEATPAAGDWSDLSFSGDSAAEIDGSTFEYGGGAHKGSSGVIRLPFDEAKMKIVNSTFRHNSGAAFESNKDCKPWESPALKNTSTGKLCEDGMFSAKALGAIGILGTLGSTGPSVSGIFDKGKLDDSAMIGLLGSSGASFGSGGLGSGGPGGGDLTGSGYGGGGSVGIGGLGTPKTKVVETSVTASGALPADVVRKVVRSRMSSLRACHSSGSGTITVSFTIDETGGVTSAKTTGGSLTDASTRSCVQGVFSGMSFPKPDGGGTTTATATHDYS